MKKYFRYKLGALCALAIFGPAAQAVVIFDFNFVVTGDLPGGSPPWATLTIADNGADNVLMTLDHNSTSVPGQFLTKLWLNMDPFPGSPGIIENSPKIVGASFGLNSEQNAGANFDMSVDFETSGSNGGANRLKPGESVSWQITGVGLTEAAFLSQSTGQRQLYGMLHLQGIPGGDSAKLGAEVVPEPMTLFGLLALAPLLARRRK